MRTAEVFYKPGLEEPAEVIQSLPEAPRSLHLVGKRMSICWRFLICVVSIAFGGFVEYILLRSFVNDASQLSLLGAAAAFPIFLIFIPWWLVASYKKRIASYLYCKQIYENGIPCLGIINTLTKISGRDMETYNIDSFRPHRHGHIRIDYTFEVDNKIKVGTVILSASSTRYLSVNDKVCVLYIPTDDDQFKSILFPIPGHEFMEIMK